MDYELQAPGINNRCFQLMVFNKVTIEKTFRKKCILNQ
jgi:hypothetical protein